MKLFVIFFFCYLNFVIIFEEINCKTKSTSNPTDNPEKPLSKNEDQTKIIEETSKETEDTPPKPTINKTEPKKVSVKTTTPSSKLDENQSTLNPSPIDQNNETPKPGKVKKAAKKGLFQSFAKSLIIRKGEEEEQDVSLKAFEGGKEEQSEEEQKNTDGFFTQLKNSYGRSCFKDIGCFSAGEYNDFTNRPVPVLPMSPETIKPIFHMYTLEARSLPRNYTYNASQSQLRYSTFNPKLRTAFIIHGFQSGLSLWMEYMKDFLQYQSDDGFNVVLVVWENGARHSSYSTAAANTRVVGACIGFFIDTLCKTFNIKNDMFDLIGHGLGCHAAGYAGKRLRDPKIHRITALDPAGIGFHFTNPVLRLDSGDATIVDVIHTDSVTFYTDGFGSKDTIGYYDFFPNGGAWQPGCPEATGVLQKLGSVTNGEEVTCSHARGFSLLYNLNKPEDDCSVVAYQCPNYEMFLEGRCSNCQDNKCQLMGINPIYWLTQKMDNQTINKKYFVNTANKEEFCLYHFQFGVHTTIDSDSTTGNLQFSLKVKLPGNETKEIEIRRIMTKTYQRKIHTFLVTFNFKIDKIYGLELQWKRYNSSERYRVNRGYKLIIPYIEINFMSHMDESIRKKHSSVLCSDSQKIIVNKEKKEFKECKPTLDQKASETDPEKMIALEWKEDIYSVDYMRAHRVFHKIAKTRIKERLKKYEIVD